MMTAQAVSTFPVSVTKLGQSALAEAERILSETEPKLPMMAWGQHGHVALREIQYVGARTLDALAESLSAALPLLDELAAQAGLEYGGCTPAYWQANAMAQRNRATLAARGGAQ